MYDQYAEAMQSLHSEEQNYEREQRESKQYDHDEHETTTYERKQYNEEVEQDIYERDDKMGAI